jgi:pseudouridine synthase
MGKPGTLWAGGGVGESGERLQKVLAARGIASRRAAEEIIKAGRVRVNGQVVREMGVKVNPERDNILVDNKQLARPRMRYIILHKPSGYITTTSDERGRWTVMQLVDVEERIVPVGRLDRDTEGLLLMTNDGEVAHRVMHPRYGIQKEYHALVSPLPGQDAVRALGAGIELRDEHGHVERTAPAKVTLLPVKHGEQWIRIIISEGRKRQVRRMLEAVGCDVQKLVRVRLGPLVLTGIPKGAWRELTPGERRELFVALKIADPEMPAEEQG